MEAVGRQIVERGPAARAGWADPAGSADPDRELLERWREGDLSAFETLVRRHEQRVFRLLVRMTGSATEAEEVAQETFLNLHRHGRRFRGEARFSTFVYRVAANAALNWRRTLGRRRARERELLERHERGEELATSPRDPEDAALGAEARARVQEALLELPTTLRLPVVLYDIEGQSYGEIAEILKLAEGTVKSRIFRARKALRERLEPLFARDTAGEPR